MNRIATERSESGGADVHALAGALDADAIDDAVQRDATRALFAQSPQGLIVSTVIGAMFVVVFLHRAGAWPTGLWAAAVVLTQLAGGFIWARFRRIENAAEWRPDRWRLAFTLRTTASGLVFGATTWLFFDPQFGDARWLTILSVCSLAAGSITAFAYHRPAMWGFLLGLALPSTVALHQFGSWVVPAVFLFYMGMLTWFGHNQSSILQVSIRRRYENAALVAKLRSQALELEQAAAVKAQFFAAASHDLRQPLQALSYYCTLLHPAAQDVANVERIQQCVGALDDLLEGVLDISRLDAGRVHAHRGPVNIADLARRVSALHEGVARAKGLRLRVRAAAAWTSTDAVLLERILGNLLSNALRYTERGGALIAVRSRGDNWWLQVIDTGCGIRPQDQQRIFDEFVQLNNPERDPARGVGLGLATVRRLCALLGHPLSLRSQLGRGSCFALALPKSQPPLDSGACIQPPAEGLELQGRVLVVEDNEPVRNALSAALQIWGLTVEATASGAAALNLAQRQQFDVVLCDWRLPDDVSGVDILRALRRCQPDLKLTALLTGETTESLGTLPANVMLLRKPVRPIRLRALLGAHLPSTDITRARSTVSTPPA